MHAGKKEPFEEGRGKSVCTASVCKHAFPEMMKALSWDQRNKNKVRFSKMAEDCSYRPGQRSRALPHVRCVFEGPQTFPAETREGHRSREGGGKSGVPSAQPCGEIRAL